MPISCKPPICVSFDLCIENVNIFIDQRYGRKYFRKKVFLLKNDFKFFLPFKLTPRFSLSFLLLNKLLMSSLVTNLSTFKPFCITTPANSFSNPSPFSPTANFGSPKNFPSLQGWSFPSKTSLKYENKVF